MRLSIRHQISIGIGEGAARAALHLLMTPQDHAGQTVREWTLEAPGIDSATGFLDGFGNRAHLVTQTRPEAEMILTATGIVETTDRSGVVGKSKADPVPALFLRVTELTRAEPGLIEGLSGHNRIARLHALMARVAESPGASDGDGEEQAQGGYEGPDGQSQSQSQSMPAGDGGEDAPGPALSPVEMAHRFIAGARALRIPARYVSGYLAEAGDAPRVHAWAEAWDDAIGWIGFDPSLQICPVEAHVRVACGLDAISAAAVRAVPAAGAAVPLALVIETAQ